MKFIGPLDVILVILVVLASCDKDPQTGIGNEPEEGSWLIYSPLKWTHDGEPITGTFCKIYSDGANEDLKYMCLDFADRMFGEIMGLFQVKDFGQFILPPENTRINVYINTTHEENIAYAYWGTIFITVRTPDLNESLYEYLFKHELTHELEFMSEGTVNLGTPVWFRESLAIYCGGGFNRITTVEDLDDWILENEDSDGQGNPLLIREWSDFPADADIDRYYWYAFDLVMRYLLDPRGLDMKYTNVLGLFYDIRDGDSFDNSFRKNFNIELEVFENEFFSMIREYLIRINSSGLNFE